MNEQTGEQDVQPNELLNAERLQKLESTGFAWSVRDGDGIYNKRWEAMFARLIQYKGIHGDCLVPYCYAQDIELAIWVENQVSMWTRETCASIPC